MRPALTREIMGLLGTGAALSYVAGRRKAAYGLLGLAGALYLAGKRGREDRLEGQAVLITGGSRGLGLALAHELVRRRCRVALLARDREELHRAKARLEHAYPGGLVKTYPCDVTHEAELFRAIDHAARDLGGLDLLVNNAGSIVVGPFRSMGSEEFRAQMELHLFAAMNACRHALPILRRGRGRRIVNICSMGGKMAVPHMLPYDTSKFALSGFSLGLNAELAEEGISVTTVYPAVMRTGSPMQAVFKGDHEKEFAWFAAADNMPLVSTAAAVAARKIVRGAEERSTELLIPGAALLRNAAAALLPELSGALLRMLHRLLPKGDSREARTGADSRALFDRVPLFAPLRWIERDAGHRWNQKAKHDGRVAMGLESRRPAPVHERMG